MDENGVIKSSDTIDLNAIFEKIGVLLDDGDFDKIIVICNELEKRGYNIPQIYQVKLMAEMRVKSIGDLQDAVTPLDVCSSYEKVLSSSDKGMADFIWECNEEAKRRYTSNRNQEIKTSYLDLGDARLRKDTTLVVEKEDDGLEYYGEELQNNRKKTKKNKSNRKTVVMASIAVAILLVIVIVVTLVFKSSKGKNDNISDATNTSETVFDSTDVIEQVEDEPTEEEKTEEVNQLNELAIVEATGKKNIPEDLNASRYSDRVEWTFKITNKSDKTIRGIQGKITVCDMFGETISTSGCDFTGISIGPNKYTTVDGMGFDINEFIDSDVKIYTTDFSDLIIKYDVSNIVYENGESEVTDPSAGETKQTKVSVKVLGKENLPTNYDVGRYSPFIEFKFSVTNNTSKSIRGVQGTLDIQDLFGETIMRSSLDFTGQTIAAGGTATYSDLGIDVNEFMDEHVKLYNEEYKDLKFDYEVTAIVYDDGTTENF